jgi:hypothetical protein
VIIAGLNLGNGSDITNVTICGTPVQSIDRQRTNAVYVTAALSANSGLGDVVVYSTSFGVTTATNAFTYNGPQFMAQLEVGVWVANDGPAFSLTSLPVGNAKVTRTCLVSNAGNETLVISDVSTTGVHAAQFAVLDMPTSLVAGAYTNFHLRFGDPVVPGIQTGAVIVTHDGAISPFRINVTFNAYELSANYGPFAGGNLVTLTNGLALGDGSDITNVSVGDVSAEITGQGTNWVQFRIPPASSAGETQVKIYSASEGEPDFIPTYVYNPAGVIGMYDLDWSKWEEVPGLPKALNAPAGGALNGCFYSAGGYDGAAVSNVYRFDGTNWSEVAGLPIALYAAAGCTMNGKFYVIGGNSGGVLTNVYSFDGTDWTAEAGLPAQREYVAAAASGPIMYAIGGRYSSAQTNVYGFNGSSWFETRGLPVAHHGMGAGAIFGATYAFGGTGSSNTYAFNGAVWNEAEPMPATLFGAGYGVLNYELYSIAGDGGSGSITNVYKFDGSSWTETASLPRRRRTCASGVLDDQLYSVGGYYTGYQTNAYRYPYRTWNQGVSPASGAATGGIQLVISGSNLGSGSDITNVTVCGYDVVSIDSQSTTQMVVTLAKATNGVQGDVRVYSTDYGETVASNAFLYEPLDEYTIQASAGANGTIQPSGAVTVAAGADQLFTFTPDDWYEVEDVLVNGASQGVMSNYNWLNVLADGTITVSFAETYVTNNTPQPIPQSWMAQYGLTNDMQTEVQDDPDGDGATTWQEYVMDSNPTSGLSVLRLENFMIGTEDSLLEWPGSSNRIYTMYWNTNMLMPLTNVLFSDYQPPESGVNTHTDAVHSVNQSIYYRLKVSLP